MKKKISVLVMLMLVSTMFLVNTVNANSDIELEIYGPTEGEVGKPLEWIATVFNGNPPYQWSGSFGDWPPELWTTIPIMDDQITISHTYHSEGVYNLYVHVKDADGDTDSVTIPITINGPSPPPPQWKLDAIIARQTPGIIHVGDWVQFKIEVTNSGNAESPPYRCYAWLTKDFSDETWTLHNDLQDELPGGNWATETFFESWRAMDIGFYQAHVRITVSGETVDEYDDYRFLVSRGMPAP